MAFGQDIARLFEDAAPQISGLREEHVDQAKPAMFSRPLLSAAQERVLARHVRNGDSSAVDDLVVANTRLVASVVRRWGSASTPGFDGDDMFQQGCLGVMRAAQKYEPQKARFSTYATLWIKQALSRGLADRGRVIRIPVHVVERLRRLEKAEKRLDAEEMFMKPEEWNLLVAEEARLEVEDIQYLREVRQIPLALDLVTEEIEDGTAPVEEIVLQRLLQAEVRRSINALGFREGYVITKRFGIDGEPIQTLDAIARSLNVTRERVRQIEKDALVELSRATHLQGLRETYNAGRGSDSLDAA